MPGGMEQAWPLQPAPEDMCALARARREDAEAASRGRSSTAAQEAKEKSFSGGMMHFVVLVTKLSKLFAGGAERNTNSNGSGSYL